MANTHLAVLAMDRMKQVLDFTDDEDILAAYALLPPGDQERVRQLAAQAAVSAD